MKRELINLWHRLRWEVGADYAQEIVRLATRDDNVASDLFLWSVEKNVVRKAGYLKKLKKAYKEANDG